MIETVRNFLFTNNTTNQTIIKNAFWLFTGEVGVRVLKIILFIYAARTLGSSQWGTFSYAIALMAIFAIISDIGVNSVLIREKSKSDNYPEFIATGVFIKITLSIIASLALLGYGLLSKESGAVRDLLPFMSIILFLDSIREFGFTLNRAFEKMELEAFGKILTTIILTILGIFLLSKNGTALSLSYAYIISSTVGVVMGCFFLRKELKYITRNFNRKLIRELLKEAWPLGLISIFGILLTNINTILLGWLKTIDMVGIYSVAQKPTQILYMMPGLIGIAVLPIFSRLAKSDKDNFKKIVKESTTLMFVMACVATLIILIFGKFLILSLFGQTYIDASMPFKIMSLALITNAPSIIFSNALFAEGRQKVTSLAIGTGVVVNLVLSFILIPSFGVNGAALSATLAQMTSNVIIITYARRNII